MMRYLRRSLAITSFLFAGSAVFAQSANSPLIVQPVDETKLITLVGNTRPEAQEGSDLGRVSDNMVLDHMLLQLQRSPEQEATVNAFIDQLHNESSPLYHQWITAAQYGQRFGLSKSDLSIVSGWLSSHGFTVNLVHPGGMLIDFTGTAGQIRTAFHTEIHNLSVNGQQHYANMGNPQIPAALAPAVAGVVSLHDFRPHAMFTPKAQYTTPISGSTYYLVGAGDVQVIYGIVPLLTNGITGTGQTIGLIEDTDLYKTADWTSFRSVFGLSRFTGATLTQIHPNCSDPGANGDDEEAILDAEYASAAAPGASIEMISCPSTGPTFGGQLALANLLASSTTPPSIVSMSYGECEAISGAALIKSFYTTFQQAVTQGISVFVSSGDDAAAGCDRDVTNATHGIAVTGWGESPYNVSVGGTDFGDSYAGTNSTYWNATNTKYLESAKSYVPEIPWNDSCASQLIATASGFSLTYGPTGFCNSSSSSDYRTTTGGSGGPSLCATGAPSKSGVVSGTCAGYQKPSWQAGVIGIPADGVRDVPDVSLFAANGVWGHFYPICFSGPGGAPCTEAPSSWPGGGGTSFSSPIMAGIQALVNQTHGAQGNPNVKYYSLAATEYGTTGSTTCNSTLGNGTAKNCVFYDITQGDMDVNCTGTVNCDLDGGKVGVLSTSTTSYLPAYGTTVGWDFATGIGSVNATNLFLHWGK